MNDNNEIENPESDSENIIPIEPSDEYPGTFFRILRTPPNLNDTWSIN